MGRGGTDGKQLTVKADQLRRGDKLVATARVVAEVHQTGVRIPAGKTEIVFTNRSRRQFNKRTAIIVERPKH